MMFDIAITLYNGITMYFENAGIYMDKYRFIITENHNEHTYNRSDVKKITIENNGQ